MTGRSGTRPAPPSQRTKHLATGILILVVAWAVLTVDVRIENLPALPGALARIFTRMFLDPSPEWAYFGWPSKCVLTKAPSRYPVFSPETAGDSVSTRSRTRDDTRSDLNTARR